MLYFIKTLSSLVVIALFAMNPVRSEARQYLLAEGSLHVQYWGLELSAPTAATDELRYLVQYTDDLKFCKVRLGSQVNTCRVTHEHLGGTFGGFYDIISVHRSVFLDWIEQLHWVNPAYKSAFYYYIPLVDDKAEIAVHIRDPKDLAFRPFFDHPTRPYSMALIFEFQKGRVVF